MWGAIIKAIDHQMDRNAKGMRSGIEVAGGQTHGAAGGASTTSSGSSGNVPQNTAAQSESMNTDAADDTNPVATAAANDQAGGDSGTLGIAEKDDNGGDSSSLGDIGSLAGEGGDEGGEGLEGAADMISDERLKAKRCAATSIKNWHNKGKLLSDASAKSAESVSEKKSGYEKYAEVANKASDGLANAGKAAIAVSQGKGVESLDTNTKKSEDKSQLASDMEDKIKSKKKDLADEAQSSVEAK